MKTIINLLRTIAAFFTGTPSKTAAVAQPAPAAANDAQPGHCSNIMTLLAHLCDLDDNLRLWVLRWLAYPLRNPGAKMSTGLIFNGGEGSGKNLFFVYVMAQIYGKQATTISHRALHSSFTDWMDGRRLVIVDEVYAAHHGARIKSLIACDELVIHCKGHPPRTVPNQLNFVFLSNHEDFLPEHISGRRFTVVEVPPARPRAFYEAVAHEIANGGVEAFRDYLLHGLPMGDFNQFTSPPAPYHSERRAA